jgi:hypothetical protein
MHPPSPKPQVLNPDTFTLETRPRPGLERIVPPPRRIYSNCSICLATS